MSLSDRIKKPLVIVNPNANEGRALEKSEPVIYSLRSAGFYCDVETPTTREEAIEIVRKDWMHEVIFGFGGDGTNNAIMNGLMQNRYREDKILVALSGGSANNIAEECGYGNLNNVCDNLIKGTEEEMDAWRVNEKEILWGFGCMGFGAAVLEERDKRRFFKRKMAYVAGALRVIFRYTPNSMRLKIDREEVDKDVYIGVVSNITLYADKMKIAPNAVSNDGQMDLCIMENLGTILQNLPAVYTGNHIKNPGVYNNKAESLVIDSSVPVQLEVDGEFLGKYDRFKFEHAGRIRVLVANGNNH
tara:strand:- start:5710 stop:6615 length:906 start_codon:yes stop_codon:yes gene_type:complete